MRNNGCLITAHGNLMATGLSNWAFNDFPPRATSVVLPPAAQ